MRQAHRPRRGSCRALAGLLASAMLVCACGSDAGPVGLKYSRSPDAQDRPRKGDCFAEDIFDEVPPREQRVPCRGDYRLQVMLVGPEITDDACGDSVFAAYPREDTGSTLLVPSAELSSSGVNTIYCIADRSAEVE